ncbi:MAG: hypothetical protein JWM42_748 [Burkholderia sp.]|nr:hypothetical protein [Burkholderia sp.]
MQHDEPRFFECRQHARKGTGAGVPLAAMLETGRYGTTDELAAAEKINSSYVSRLLRLTLLATDIVEAILDGRQPDGMALPGLMEPFPLEWGSQLRRLVGQSPALVMGRSP